MSLTNFNFKPPMPISKVLRIWRYRRNYAPKDKVLLCRVKEENPKLSPLSQINCPKTYISSWASTSIEYIPIAAKPLKTPWLLLSSVIRSMKKRHWPLSWCCFKKSLSTTSNCNSWRKPAYRNTRTWKVAGFGESWRKVMHPFMIR